MTYQERLLVPVSWWLIGAGLLASLAVAVYAYVNIWPATVIVALGGIMLVVGLAAYTMRICVQSEVLTVGRHRLEARYIAGAEVMSEAPKGSKDASSFFLTRAYAPFCVRVRIDDSADPHPAWIVSTRQPEQFAKAVQSIRNRQEI